MNRPVRVFTVIIFVLAVYSLHAQDPTFSQFDANQIYYNPAYTGYKEEARVELDYRNLWPNVPGKTFPGPLSTYSATGDAYLSIQNRFNAGVGGFVMQDVEGQGFLTTTSAGICYSQHMPNIRGRSDRMDRFKFYLGFKVYYSDIHIDWSRLVFSDQLNPNYGITGPSSFTQTNINNRSYFDVDWGGLMLNNFRAQGKWYNELGFSMAHVLAPNISITGSNADDTRLPRKYDATYRSTISVDNGNFFLGPAVLFENQAKFFEVNPGMDFYLKLNNKNETIPLSIGLYNRFSFILKNEETGEQKINTSAAILVITHRGTFSNGKSALGYNVGVSVDFPYGGLGMQTAGAYEFTAGITIPYHRGDTMRCPFEQF